MFANLAPLTTHPMPLPAFAIALAVLLSLAGLCHLCRPRVSIHAPAGPELLARWQDHYARHHYANREQCRPCYRGEHQDGPHPAESGAPCECSCALTFPAGA